MTSQATRTDDVPYLAMATTQAEVDGSSYEQATGGGNLKQRAAAGVAALLVRRVAAQIIAIVGTTLVLRLLPVEAFGIYAIVLFVVTLGGYFANAGLGAALLQRKEEITQDDLDVVFTVQVVLLGLATGVIIFIAPWVQQQYSLPDYVSPMLSVLALSLFISSFKTVPAIILERRLQYSKLSVSDIAELMTFHTLSVVLAILGLGVWSFILAALAQSIVGSVALGVLCPWRLRLNRDLARARHLLRFGALFQARTFVIVVKDNITPTLIAFFGGPLAVGYIGFAQKVAAYPLLVEAATSRVAFPAYSRIQEDLSRLKSAIEKTLKLVNIVLFPLIGLLIALAEPLTRFVFGGDKWAPALPALYLFSIANLTAGTSNVLVTSLYSLGRPGVVLKLSTFWAVATWILALPLVLVMGWMGLPIAVALLAVTVVLPVREVNKQVRIDVIEPLVKPAVSASLATGLVFLLGIALNGSVIGLIVNGALGLLFYAALIILLDGRWLAHEFMSSLTPQLSERLLRTPIGRFLTP